MRANLTRLNPTRPYVLWGTAAAEVLLRLLDRRTRGTHGLLAAFRAGADKWRTDLLRFAILSAIGGVYTDVDIEWLVPFERVLSRGAHFYSALSADSLGAHAPPMVSIGFLASVDGPEPLLAAYIRTAGARLIANASYVNYAYNIIGVARLLRAWVGPASFGGNRLMMRVPSFDPAAAARATNRRYFLFQERPIARSRVQKRVRVPTILVDEAGERLANVNGHHYLQRGQPKQL